MTEVYEVVFERGGFASKLRLFVSERRDYADAVAEICRRRGYPYVEVRAIPLNAEWVRYESGDTPWAVEFESPLRGGEVAARVVKAPPFDGAIWAKTDGEALNAAIELRRRGEYPPAASSRRDP